MKMLYIVYAMVVGILGTLVNFNHQYGSSSGYNARNSSYYGGSGHSGGGGGFGGFGGGSYSGGSHK